VFFLLVLFTSAAMASPHRGGQDPMVTTVNDGGPGSLRDAIATAQSGKLVYRTFLDAAVQPLAAYQRPRAFTF